MSSQDVMVVAGLFVAAYILQFYLSYLQMKHITKQYLELTNKYKCDYFIGMNQKKKIGCNPVVILVTDDRNMIQEFYMLGGLLVTSRMKRVNLEEEVNIAGLENHKEYIKRKVGEKGFVALQNAAENILNYC